MGKMDFLSDTLVVLGSIGLAIFGTFYSSHKLSAIWICFGAVVVILFGLTLRWALFAIELEACLENW
jgi:hypothetical protein